MQWKETNAQTKENPIALQLGNKYINRTLSTHVRKSQPDILRSSHCISVLRSPSPLPGFDQEQAHRS
jgi:hypothetical protein